MLHVLGIDTATWTAAVGISDGERVVAERSATTGKSHVGHLPELVRDTLEVAGLTITDVDAVAVSAGPGSFTGLRIGVAFAKGLAFAGGLPLAGVATLEAHAVATGAAVGTRICVANDARRGEVWAALFEVSGADRVERRWPDRAWLPEALAAALPPGTMVVGDGRALVMGEPEPAGAARDACVAGGAVAVLGARALAAGRQVDVGRFEPTYVRGADATLPDPPLR